MCFLLPDMINAATHQLYNTCSTIAGTCNTLRHESQAIRYADLHLPDWVQYDECHALIA
jgi:hypothetical protein